MAGALASHDELRPLMFSIAYRMLGSVSEAEDTVQDAIERIFRAERAGTVVDNPEAFATTVTTRLAIDALRSVRSRREHYVGSWLPEPLIEEDARQAAGAVAPVSRPGTGHGRDRARQVEMDETLSTAVLVLMEQLAPVERAVFVLREVLGYDYRQIAEAVDKSEANCRQLYARAKRRIDSGRPDFDTDRVVREKVVREFVTALREADLARLEALLVEDVVFMGDGGGKAPAIRIPAVGAQRVARFILGLVGQAQRASVDIVETTANGSPAFLLRADRAVVGVLTLEISGGRIVALRNQINPDKLSHLNRDFEERPGPSHA
jgi:RNA polymerase sigma-70 factor (ECF subfamily)